MRLSTVRQLTNDGDLISVDDRCHREPTQSSRAADLARDQEWVVRGCPYPAVILKRQVEHGLRGVLSRRSDTTPRDFKLGRQRVDMVAGLDLRDRDQVVVLRDHGVADKTTRISV